jgi:hypothetical protein
MRNTSHFIGTRRALKSYNNLQETRALLDRMADRADADPEYGRAFANWLEHGSTIKLRELAQPFGDFWHNRHNFNILNAIDSAHLHRFDPVPE